MFVKGKSIWILVIGGLMNTNVAQAATASSSGSGNNNYLFIENNVDREYFITSSKLDPRFSGANIWTRYSTNQTSLGYMGAVGWNNTRRYFDMWLSDSPINSPFTGIRCMSSGSTCPSSGYIPADVIDNEGFYHAYSGSSVYNGSYGFASFSQSAFEHFRSKPVGSSEQLVLNWCHTTTNYDYASGVRCRDLTSGATWRYYTFTLNKVGHLTLNSTGAMAELWVASDGTPSINSGNEFCYLATVNNTQGAVCKMVAYSLEQSASVTTYLGFRMVIDNAALGFSPTTSEIRYSPNGSTWYNHGTRRVYTDVFKTDGDYVYVFLANSFFKKVLNSGKDITNNDSIFTFSFNNTVTPESGYYQFTASSLLNIIPKEYGISIVSTDGKSHPTASGRIGDDSPIEFDYTVTVSAARQADSILAQVVGDSVQIGGKNYCLFRSTDNTLNVPIPAYLSYTQQSGAQKTEYNSCADQPVNITDARWSQTTWNSAIDDGFFYKTTLKLLFPMNDVISERTVDGIDWMGTVYASGEVKVTATWIGVDR